MFTLTALRCCQLVFPFHCHRHLLVGSEMLQWVRTTTRAPRSEPSMDLTQTARQSVPNLPDFRLQVSTALQFANTANNYMKYSIFQGLKPVITLGLILKLATNLAGLQPTCALRVTGWKTLCYGTKPPHPSPSGSPRNQQACLAHWRWWRSTSYSTAATREVVWDLRWTEQIPTLILASVPHSSAIRRLGQHAHKWLTQSHLTPRTGSVSEHHLQSNLWGVTLRERYQEQSFA